MDFVEGLPKSKGKDVIMVVVDRLTKFGHFISLSHSFTAQEVARTFLDRAASIHGVPKKVFTSFF